MSQLTDLQDRTEMVYRVDKFVAPASAREELLSKVNLAHRLLHDQSGFVYDLILEDTSDNGSFRLVTLVAWRDADAMSQARDAVRQMHQREGFDPQQLLARLGVSADLGTYSSTEPGHPGREC